MKYCLVLSLIILSCNFSKKSFPFIPEEYNLSEGDKVKGKILCYLDQVSGEHTYYDVYYKDILEHKFLVVTSYTDSIRLDSVLELNNKIYESYSYFQGGKTLTKNQILSDTIINDGSKLGIYKSNFISLLDSVEMTVSSKSQYLKDTIFNWQNSLIPTIAIQTTWDCTIKDRYSKSDAINFTMEFQTYYAKGIGRVRLRVYNINDKQFKNIDLIAIRDKKH